jgi:putative Holliday junction resolvase
MRSAKCSTEAAAKVRIVGLDLGEKRIGVAAADDRTGVAVPVTTVDTGQDIVSTVSGIVREQAADELVVGLPLSMSGALGPQAQKVASIVEDLREQLEIPVHTWDERLSSVQASRGAPQLGRKKSARTAVAGRDAAAASIILQAFLDRRRLSIS